MMSRSRLPSPNRRSFRSRAWPATRALLPIMAIGLAAGCPAVVPPFAGDGTAGRGGGMGLPVYNNTNDITNDGATHIGSAACAACHPSVAALHEVHGHAHILTPIEGGPPVYPEEAPRAAVPNPPSGSSWSEIAFVIGGYTKAARFVSAAGFILTTGADVVNTQWNLLFPPNGTTAGFAVYDAARVTPKPYDVSCFQCHATGAQPPDAERPLFVQNRPGMAGTFEEPGVQCEACHGPGSKHIPDPAARSLFVDLTGSQTCARCHSDPGGDDGTIQAAGGFIRHYEQESELRASGGHASFTCGTCHDSHTSTIFDRDNGIRNDCRVCHADQNMALHAGKVFTRGDYTEPLSCESCHMPFATMVATAATADTIGTVGRMGDTRTHIFRIDTRNVDYTAMFNEAGDAVVTDNQGRAAVTVDFVCLRCHTPDEAAPNTSFPLRADNARNIADDMHSK